MDLDNVQVSFSLRLPRLSLCLSFWPFTRLLYLPQQYKGCLFFVDLSGCGGGGCHIVHRRPGNHRRNEWPHEFLYHFQYALADPAMKQILYFTTVFFLCVSVMFALFLTRSRFGRLLQAVRDGENRVRFSGIIPPILKCLFTVYPRDGGDCRDAVCASGRDDLTGNDGHHPFGGNGAVGGDRRPALHFRSSAWRAVNERHEKLFKRILS